MMTFDVDRAVIVLLRKRKARLEEELERDRYNRSAKQELKEVSRTLAAEEWRVKARREKGKGEGEVVDCDH